ncbi:MAG: hypothetical protein KA731_02275 [Candidatus Moranbacteria bacterium]|nr:hypothetical protein [Candidatus Moranbacteria bacterium]MBP6034227.1 hypothetical protein [Candidatus Moranbacteria bacterium]
MNPNAPKNREFIKRYPFLSAIINSDMEPSPIFSPVNDLTIHVKKADGDLMFRQAHNVGLAGDSSCIFQLTDKRKGQVMRRGEYLFAVDSKMNIINRVDWPRNDEERKVTGEIYGRKVFWSKKTSFTNGSPCYTDPIFDTTEYLVWLTVEAWHADTEDNGGLGSRFGKFIDRSVDITIYRKPEQGFRELEEESSVYSNLSLDTRLMMRGALEKNPDILIMSGMLYEMCIFFQDEVYFNGMKAILDEGTFRGASGQFGPVKVLCAEMCGYDRIMLEDATSYVTFQLRPGSKHLYVLGQQGTLPRIRNLVRTVVKMWGENPASRAAFKPDENVSVL